jgi:pimeloyl-ACP methyl ester carboxylesterase
VHLAPANGFPPATYVPALGGLTRDHRVVSLPPKALWPDAGPPPAEPGSWESLADDLLEGMRRHELDGVIGIGHSFGAVATLLAAVREPRRFRALVFLDPTILPPAIMDDLRGLRARGEMSFRPLVQGALKRRAAFATEAEAFAYWRDKALFADWSDDAVRHYTRSMLRPAEPGGFSLAWSPAWEAWYYMSFYPDSWAALEQLDAAIPLLVVRGERSDTFFAEAEALFRRIRPGATFHVLPSRGHLFPQAAPEETARLLQEWLAATPG